MAEKKPKAVKEEKEAPAKDSQNGVTRPGAGTKTGIVWQVADSMSRDLGKPVGRKAVLDATGKLDVNTATAATQYGRWRKYNGLEGRGIEEETPAAE